MRIRSLAVTLLASACATAPAITPVATKVTVAPSRADAPATRNAASPAPASASAPSLLVHVEAESAELASAVRGVIAQHAFATAWPGGLPARADLESRGAAAYIVVPTVQEVSVQKTGTSASITCRIEITVAPWHGTDGGERWEVERAANASGTARATTSTRGAERGVRDCLHEVAISVTTNRILPFIRRAPTSVPGVGVSMRTAAPR